MSRGEALLTTDEDPLSDGEDPIADNEDPLTDDEDLLADNAEALLDSAGAPNKVVAVRSAVRAVGSMVVRGETLARGRPPPTGDPVTPPNTFPAPRPYTSFSRLKSMHTG